jgi:hypothetical protein
MANVNNPYGLLHIGTSLSGGPLTIQRFPKLVGYATAIFMNDPVNRVSGGSIQASATPGTSFYSGVSLEYSAASTAATPAIVISPDALYTAQDSGANSPYLTAAQMGLNANLLSGAGSTTTKQSAWVIDDTNATVTTTNTLDVHLLQAWTSPDNVYGQYARIEIVFNKQRMSGATVGV